VGIPLPLIGAPTALDEVKLRLAFGETGNRPWYGDKYTSVSQGTVGGQTSYRTATATSAADLRPERQREIEGGIDLSLFNERASIELTAFRRSITGILLAAQSPPSTGYVSLLTNIGRLRTHGYEAAASAIPVRRTSGLTWTTRGTFGMTRSMILQLAGDTIQTRGSRVVGRSGSCWRRCASVDGRVVE
jgi:outer membrane receptor protein involved in Fe transport